MRRFQWAAIACVVALAGCNLLLGIEDIPQDADTGAETGTDDASDAGLDATDAGCTPDGSYIVSLSAGGGHVCAVLAGGTIKCWGSNGAGQLGDNTTNTTFTPVSVPNITNAIQVACGGIHTCALLDGGTVRCWGSNQYGQCSGTPDVSVGTPRDVGLTNVAEISAGTYHTCAIVEDGGAFCWGRGTEGQLGYGGNATAGFEAGTPVGVTGQANGFRTSRSAMELGAEHTCAVSNNLTANCWGNDDAGQSQSANPLVAGFVAGSPSSVSEIAAGLAHSCLISAGHVFCWGDQTEILVDAGPDVFTVPIVSNAQHIFIGPGSRHSCATRQDGTLACWGVDAFGEVRGASSLACVTDVAVGDFFTCAVSGGGVYCWGVNDYDQLGRDGGDTSPNPTPTPVLGL